MTMTILVSTENPTVDQKTLKTWDLKALETLIPGAAHHLPDRKPPATFALKMGYCIGSIYEGNGSFDMGFLNEDVQDLQDYPDIIHLDDAKGFSDLKESLEEAEEFGSNQNAMYEITLVARRMDMAEVIDRAENSRVQAVLDRLSTEETDLLRDYFQKPATP